MLFTSVSIAIILLIVVVLLMGKAIDRYENPKNKNK